MRRSGPDDAGKLLLRLALGGMVGMHGVAKLTHGFGGVEGLLRRAGLPAELAWASLLGEVLGPLLLIVGWHARVGAALIAVNMLVAIALAHLPELLQRNASGGWAVELQAMFLIAAVVLAMVGPGRFSANGR